MIGNQKDPHFNPFLEREVEDVLRRHAWEDLEKIPELRELLQLRRDEHATKAMLAESLNVLPYENLQKLFSDYIEEHFELHLHRFFDRLYNGHMKILQATIEERLTGIETKIDQMRRSLLMAAVHPYAWVEYELAEAVVKFLRTQPGNKSSVYGVYQHLAFSEFIPLPGISAVEKLNFVLSRLRRMENLREWEGFLFEMITPQVQEEKDSYATAAEYGRTALEPSLRAVDKKKKKVPR